MLTDPRCTMGTFMWHPDYSTFPQLVKAGHQCGEGKKVFLGNVSSLMECAAACHGAAGCRFFIYGTGKKAGSCFQEGTESKDCERSSPE